MGTLVKRVFATTMLAVFMLCISACGGGEKPNGKITISIGDWPEKGVNPAADEAYDRYEKMFAEKRPDVTLVHDSYKFDTQTFMAKAVAKQLPDMMTVPYTEIGKLIDNKLAADITAQMDKFGFMQNMSPSILDLVTRDGKIYFVPSSTYAMGIHINKDLFKKAGLTNADGTCKIPETYEELAETAKIIHEKTGAAGLMMGTMNGVGGWHFMNVAWSYGAEFIKEEGGKWKAVFNSPECAAALTYIKDLKWKYGALGSNDFVDAAEQLKQFAAGNAGMIVFQPVQQKLFTNYGMDKDSVEVISMPKGPKGRCSLMGGSVRLINPDTTEEERDAVFDFFEVVGESPKVTDSMKEAWELSAKQTVYGGGIVLASDIFPKWINTDRTKIQEEIFGKYVNVDMANYQHYIDFNNVIIKSEYPVCCQELYSVLDGCIQEVLTNQNAVPSELLEGACSDFQKNHLDKLEDQ